MTAILGVLAAGQVFGGHFFSSSGQFYVDGTGSFYIHNSSVIMSLRSFLLPVKPLVKKLSLVSDGLGNWLKL